MKDKIIKKLTDAYNKNPDSNLGKIIGIMVSPFGELQETFEKIESWRSIDEAEGQVLDDIGVDINQYRGKSSDSIYRIMLKSKTARDLSTGDTNTIIEVLSMAIDAKKEDVGIVDDWIDGGDAAAIKIIEVPIEALNKVGMSSEQFIKFVSATLAAGVYLKSIDLLGTFEYGSINEDYDEEKGFADIDQTVGGYYGALYEAEEDAELPW